MTDLRQLLAANLKRFRSETGLSQAKLAEKAQTSTHYVGMIELGRKFPSPDMLAKLAEALGVDTPELFSQPPTPAGTLRKLQLAMTRDMEDAVARSVTGVLGAAIREAAGAVAAAHCAALEGEEKEKNLMTH